MTIEIPNFLPMIIEKIKSDQNTEQFKTTFDDGKYTIEFREDLWSVKGDDRNGDFYQRYKMTIQKVGDVEFKPYEKYELLKQMCECDICKVGMTDKDDLVGFEKLNQ